MRIVSIITFLVLSFSGPAIAQEMCFDREFSDTARYEVEVGWARPNPLDPTPETVTAVVNSEELLTALRGLSNEWRTPSSIWPKSAVHIKIYERGLLRCQAIYTREQIYAQDKDLNGFLRRPLAVLEYFAINEALGLPSYASPQ